MNSEDPIREALALWETSSGIPHFPPSTPKPRALVIVDKIIKECPDAEERLMPLVGHQNALVIAFTLLTLQKLQASRWESLWRQFVTDERKVPVCTGSFVFEKTLGDFVKRLLVESEEQKKHGQRS
ncbi:MAG: hypothetical protein AB1705_02395 [Verrucomicrobiota bacterium]